MKVKTPGEISRQAKELALQTYEQSLERVGDEECVYIGRYIDRKVASLRNSSIGWVRDLWLLAASFFHVYSEHMDGVAALSPPAQKVVISALHYLVNPFDSVPDHIPSRGYEDDAAVLNRAARDLEKLHPGFLEDAAARVRSELGAD